LILKKDPEVMRIFLAWIHDSSLREISEMAPSC
jgi:hypothetical protein